MGLRCVACLRLCPVLILMITVCGAPLGLARTPDTIPLAPLPDQSVWSEAYKARQGAVYEARARSLGLQKAFAGDPAKTAAMDAYDAHFYFLDLDLDPSVNILTATVAMAATVVADSLTEAELHLDNGMLVSATRAGGVAVAWTHGFDLLDVTLDRTYLQGESFTIEVDYAGNPAGDYFGWSSYNGAPLIWTLSEPYGAREWWPCKDLNSDKADSVAVDVTVPDSLVVAGNGLLMGTDTPEPGKTTYHWRERHPIATYLVSATAHPYTLIEDTYTGLLGETMPLQHYVVADKVAEATAGYAPTADMIHTFALAYGEYPFLDEKYGHAHFLWGGGMEHQTCSSMGFNYYNQTFVAHELAHQWFGDNITCADFHHIWLNEGFATWSEAYWLEQSQGELAYKGRMNQQKYLGAGSVYVYDVSNFNGIFNYWTTYAKASWVVHMLRHVMGESDFFAALADYRAAYGDSSATTEQFQAVCEQVSGLDLGQFMSQWIYGEYYPQYGISWTKTPVGPNWRVDLRIKQTQTNAGLFSMPLDIRVTTPLGDEAFVVQNQDEVQWYHFMVAHEPEDVLVDPDAWVLCEQTDLGISGVVAPAAEVSLLGAVPNPFNPRTSIRLSLPTAQEVGLVIYDLAGRRVRDLAPGLLSAGEHDVLWDGRDQTGREAASGTYFVRMTAGETHAVNRLTLVR